MTADPPPTGPPTTTPAGRARLLPLYAAGFVTAFGAHSIAASLGGITGSAPTSLLALGILLAIYDGAEVLLKPVFGSLADRIGPRPVLLGGLVAFALASGAFVLAGSSAGAIGLARLGQGAAAAAFSPAAAALVARLTPGTAHGRAFGGYGAWKGLGYTLGPLLGGVLIHIGGFPLLFTTLAGLAAAVAVWAVITVPSVAALPRARQTVLGLVRRLAEPGFLRPTFTLAATTAALSVGVGFLPVRGAAAGLGPLATGAVVSVLAAAAALIQPWAGRARDAGRLPERGGMAAGLFLAALGFVLAATVPGLPGLIPAAIAVGAGVGAVTPLTFAALAATAPPERLGQTMGAAEVGREIGDAGGPLLVGAVAAATSLPLGLGALAALLATAGAMVTGRATRARG
ncbi:MFS transporter [Pseudonocardia bannensis]|uniref:MFS transporter n=1 Tax=Pseudonocardia bannensis TaxID=630973 RepID=A0A848DFH4_9PSEU|nr:MFS transporter [Pseudonocardia bannensis]NMH91293.1 MFS transporter [Pseudonocardia bannensis]